MNELSTCGLWIQPHAFDFQRPTFVTRYGARLIVPGSHFLRVNINVSLRNSCVSRTKATA
jgi:hypothetical protein